MLYKIMGTLGLGTSHPLDYSSSSSVLVLVLVGRPDTPSISPEISVSGDTRRCDAWRKQTADETFLNRSEIGILHAGVWPRGLVIWELLLLGSYGRAILRVLIWRLPV